MTGMIGMAGLTWMTKITRMREVIRVTEMVRMTGMFYLFGHLARIGGCGHFNWYILSDIFSVPFVLSFLAICLFLS